MPDLPAVRDALSHAAQLTAMAVNELDADYRDPTWIELGGREEMLRDTITDTRRHLDRAEAALTRTEADHA